MERLMIDKNAILKFAREYDPDANTVKKEKASYKGMEVYSCFVTENGVPVQRSIGLPYFILYDQKTQKLEYITGDECLEILQLL